jgi:DNA polymerase-3 subunit gamma/tau
MRLRSWIEDVRELRDKVHIVPTSARYKVYIIDEIHMLTTPAFNALLKTLEEPPAHVVFILATTEMHKLPETIVSRTQHYAFRPVPKKQVIAHLRSIATAENITITDDALGLIADYGGGSFRDSIGLLDQIQNFDTEITVDTVRSLTGIAPEESIQALMSALVTHSPSDVVMQLYALKEQGVEAAAIARQLSSAIESDILSKKPSFEPARRPECDSFAD